MLFTLVACSHKPADTASNAASNTAAPPNAPPSNTASGNAMNSPTAATTPTPEAAAPAGAAPTTATAPAAAPMPAPAPQAVVVPAGKTLTVRLGNAVGSKISSPGDSFSATLASAITVDGNIVIPAGATARGTVVDAEPLGKLKGGALLELKLTSITVNENGVPIATSVIRREMKGKGKRTAAMAGGGGAFGAIVGGLAGGGKGAAIGALAGGGAGTAGAAYTGNNDIVLPAESALSFRLKSPLQVNPAN
ncbi:MAG: hypothetical protein WBE45_00100 [Terriglobales bacterium]